MKSARVKNYEVLERLERFAPNMEVWEAEILRRADLALFRWCENECNGHIQYDENYENPVDRWGNKVPDRETGAKKRIQAICDKYGLHWYYQTDPRGCQVYISDKPMTPQNYSSVGITVYVQ